LLNYLAELRAHRGMWFPLPREANDWWRKRHNMQLREENGQWRIDGAGADRARVGYALVENGKVNYKIEGPMSDP